MQQQAILMQMVVAAVHSWPAGVLMFKAFIVHNCAPVCVASRDGQVLLVLVWLVNKCLQVHTEMCHAAVLLLGAAGECCMGGCF